jgi:hypothetical protein
MRVSLSGVQWWGERKERTDDDEEEESHKGNKGFIQIRRKGEVRDPAWKIERWLEINTTR